MKRAFFSFCLLLCFFFVGCALDNTKEEWINPISDVQVSEDTCDANTFCGTYEMYNVTTSRYYFVSICTDGTVISVPMSYLHSTYDENLSVGKWFLSDSGALTISIMGTEYANRVMSDYTDSTSKKIGFKFALNKYCNLLFEKKSDNYISKEVYSEKNLIYDCYWVRTDDYGVSYAYKFYPNGKCEYYISTQEDGCSTSDYSVSRTGCKIRFDSNSGISNEYNWCVINDYLYLGSMAYKCVGKMFPANKDTETQIKDKSIKEKLLGIWILTNSRNEVDIYDFIVDNTVFRIGCYAEGHQFRESGTWHVENGEIKLSFESSTMTFKPVFKEEDNSIYMSGYSLGTFKKIYSNGYILGDYKGRPSGYRNLLAGTWKMSDDLSFTFNSDGTGTAIMSDSSIAITWYCEENNDNRLTVKMGDSVLIDNVQWCLISENPLRYPATRRLMLNLDKTTWRIY